ncbi:MAG TPA: PP2C family protein-serine/threonine phosphatase [Phycisphaerales bacterium]|nr:PP2C family protein-serine/threonine phosphatase [Phycisphaerales bacterium]
MRNHCIALITEGSTEAGHWWEPIARAWPHGLPLPKLEPVTPGDAMAAAESGKAQNRWDAAVLAMPRGGEQDDAGGNESLMCRVLDLFQQSMIPTLLLVHERSARLEEFHPGAVIVQPMNANPAGSAAMLYALAARQTAVRSMEQSLKLAQSFQGETSAEIDRLHQELLLAARVQRDFMPKTLPSVAGFEAQVLFRPQGFVSGDTYDVSRLDEHHVGFFLADAMGHGVPAALMTLFLTGSLPRKEITSTGYRLVPPGEALSRLNNGLQECMAGPARFATAISGIVNTRTGLITLACAGHPPPLRIGPSGVRPVEVSGMLLGVVADYEYEQVTIRLEEDEFLVLHSDGIEGAFSPRHTAPSDIPNRPCPPHYGFLAGMRRGESMRDMETAMRRLAADIDAQVGSLHQDDDLTVLSLRTGAAAARPEDSANHEVASAV